MAMGMRITVWVIGITSLLVSYAGATDPVKFGYSGAIGPEKWGSLSPGFQTCSKGTLQSPIDIVKKEWIKDPTLEPLDRNYVDANATLINNGFNIALKYDDGVGFIAIDGKKYNLKQIHWHTPSEHTINGVRYSAELHLVHNSDDGNITVIAMLFRYGRPNPFLSKLKPKLVELAKEACGGDEEAHVPVGVVEAKAFIRATTKYFRYVGSLTVPPCTENVIWNILGKVREISREQVEELKAVLDMEYRNNSRPLQPRDGRKVYLYSQND